MTEPLLLTTTDAARLLSCSRDTVVRLVRAGRLPAVDIGTVKQPRLRIPRAALEAFASARVEVN